MKYDPKLYDSDSRDFLKEEVDFYLELIKRYKPKKILELGVGTGRIFSKLLDFVEYAVGIDNSDEMLGVCDKKCGKKDNYKLINSDFTSFQINEKFDFIYLPFNTFQHILKIEDQIKCLDNIKKHLSDNGIFILDVMNSKNVEIKLSDWKEDYKLKLGKDLVLQRFQRTLDIDSDQNIVHKQFKYLKIDNNQTLLEENVFDALMKITPNRQLEEIIEQSGLEILEKWSDYLFGSNDETKKIIYCLKKHEN